MRKRTLLCLTIGSLFTLAVQLTFSQDASQRKGSPPAPELFEEPNWQAVCAQAIAAPLPPAAAALAREASTEDSPPNQECNQEQALYYGFGKPPDYGAALRCAYWHRAHPAVEPTGFPNGAGTLSMLYANGNGVPRNYALAIRFACEADNSGGQNTEERIGRLEALRDGKPTPDTTFDLCDEQMSGFMGAYCSDLDEQKADVGRMRRIKAVENQLPEPAKAMLPKLQAAETAFEQARIHGEYTGGGGSGAAGFALDDQNLLREQFVINLERFAKGNVPKATPANREQTEEELSAAYGAVQAIPAPDPNEAHNFAAPPIPQGFAATEAAWQALFQEWMRFVPVAYPKLSQDAAATELLRLRIHQLKSLAR